VKRGWSQQIEIPDCPNRIGRICKIEEFAIKHGGGTCPEGLTICCYFCSKRFSCKKACRSVESGTIEGESITS